MQKNSRALIVPIPAIVVILLLCSSCKKNPADDAAVITKRITSISDVLAVCGGTVTSLSATQSGICWSTAHNPTVLSSLNATSAGDDDFVLYMTGLTPATTYYVRAFAAFSNDEVVYGNEISFTTAPAIGQSYGGGLFAYLLAEGDPGYIATEVHGLVLSGDDLSVAAIWGCDGTDLPGADGAALGSGRQNTADIVAGCTAAGIGARLCADYATAGYDDWFLPALNELELLSYNSASIDSTFTGTYLSSTEEGTTGAASMVVGPLASDCYYQSAGKSDPLRVRAVRAF